MNIFCDAGYVIGAYLLGSIPQLFVLAKLKRVRLDGDYHMSLWQRAGLALAVVGILLEFAKGALSILVGRWMGFDLTVIAIGGVAAVCGQMWPVFQKFDGEKGNTIGLAMAAALNFQAIIIGIVPVAIGAAVRTAPRIFGRSSKRTSIFGGPNSLGLPLGMFLGFLLLPIASWWLNHPPVITWAFGATFILILIRRLTAGIRSDLKISSDWKRIFWGRLLLDRGVSKYRITEASIKKEISPLRIV
jgi:acyl phosphate:glycerol-3-phosphate acyltransferase